MKRLVKAENLTPLNELSEADVRHDRCPICNNKHLDRQEGYKVCPVCNTRFKLFKGKVYIV